jgi:hypothetical protein
VLRGHEGAVDAVAISPDNHWLVTASVDRTARLWDLTAKNPAASPVVLRGHEKEVSAVAISPDNHWLLTGSQDQTARLWPLQINDLIELARVTVGRNFSVDEWQLYFPGQPYHQTFAQYQGQTTKYASIPNMATDFQRHIGQANAKNFFSHLTPTKKLELIKRNIQNVLFQLLEVRGPHPKLRRSGCATSLRENPWSMITLTSSQILYNLGRLHSPRASTRNTSVNDPASDHGFWRKPC